MDYENNTLGELIKTVIDNTDTCAEILDALEANDTKFVNVITNLIILKELKRISEYLKSIDEQVWRNQ